MSDLTVQCYTPFNPEIAGMTVEAWPASGFLHVPASTDAYPPAASPAASATTGSGGTCTLTGLSAVNYWVSVIDASNKPNFFYVPASYVGGGTFTCRYTPDPYQTPVVPNFFVAELWPGDGTSVGAIEPFVLNPTLITPNIQASGDFHYKGTVTSQILRQYNAGDTIGFEARLILPRFDTTSGSWLIQFTVFITNKEATQQVAVQDLGISVSPISGNSIQCEPNTSWNYVAQTGTDLVIPSSPGSVKTTAGGFYTLQVGCELIGGSLT